MRWPRRSRRAGADKSGAGPLGGYTPGSWAQAAEPGPQSVLLPPPESTVTVVAAPAAPNPPPRPAAQIPPPFVQPPLVSAPPSAPPAPSPTVPMPPTVEAPAVAADPSVRLGFADGSGFELHPEDPNAVALKAVADVLTLRGPHPLG